MPLYEIRSEPRSARRHGRRLRGLGRRRRRGTSAGGAAGRGWRAAGDLRRRRDLRLPRPPPDAGDRRRPTDAPRVVRADPDACARRRARRAGAARCRTRLPMAPARGRHRRPCTPVRGGRLGRSLAPDPGRRAAYAARCRCWRRHRPTVCCRRHASKARTAGCAFRRRHFRSWRWRWRRPGSRRSASSPRCRTTSTLVPGSLDRAADVAGQGSWASMCHRRLPRERSSAATSSMRRRVRPRDEGARRAAGADGRRGPAAGRRRAHRRHRALPARSWRGWQRRQWWQRRRPPA